MRHTIVDLTRNVLVVMWLIPTAMAHGAGDEFEQAPIRYSSQSPSDPVARLMGRLASGEVRLQRDPAHGYLPSLLQALKISPASQVLVFSKTSLQIHRISPTNPRAIYFNDSVYVGFVPGSDTLELSANDPQLGAVFYTLDSQREDPAIESLDDTPEGASKLANESSDGLPRILRDRGQCLSCHATSRTEGVPGHLMRSIFPDRSGRARTGSATYSLDDRTPFSSRWGGWYVTGHHGAMRHMGNTFAVERNDPQAMDVETQANRLSLPSWVRPGLHLTPHSDLVALMILEHQVRVHNLITRANYETRQTIYLDEVMNKAIGRPPEYRSESTGRRIAAAGDALLQGLLMIDEFRLETPVSGTSTFADEFVAIGPTTNDGRSLRQLDLKHRLFQYPLSYLIYTPEFRDLPQPMMDYVRHKLTNILAGNEAISLDQISIDDRKSLLEILRETMPELLE